MIMFDNAIKKYFSELVLDENGGQWRSCRLSGQKFYVRPEDIVFYKKIGVPLPTLCLDERLRKKFAFSSAQLFYNTSDKTGNKIVSMYPPDNKYKIYEHKIWFSDEWDPMEYQVEYDPNNSFFEQFAKLFIQAPRFALFTDESNENSDFTNNSVRLKNCYLVFNSLDGEDSYYTRTLLNSKNCFGGTLLFNCDTCYECAQAHDSYNCYFGEQIKNCRDGYFLFDCRGCSDCFMCANLRNKQYFFKNKQLTKEEYFDRIKEINLGSWQVLQKFQNQFDQMKKTAIYRQNHNENSIDADGDYIFNSKNVYRSFYILNSENIAYSSGFAAYKDSFDTLGGGGGEQCYELATVSTEGNYRVFFSSFINHSTNLEYCDSCFDCHDCFGCVGLRYKSFCIGNKQYTKDEYHEKVNELKTEMLKRGEYGEFFPPNISPYPYEVSDAFISGPEAGQMENARKFGYNLSTNIPTGVEDSDKDSVLTNEIIADNLPDDIGDVGEEILSKIIVDKKNQKKFRYISQELYYHKKYNLALPREHPAVRRERIMNSVLPLGFWIYENYTRNCDSCEREITSVYKPDFAGKVYCEGCYQNNVV